MSREEMHHVISANMYMNDKMAKEETEPTWRARGTWAGQPQKTTIERLHAVCFCSSF